MTSEDIENIKKKHKDVLKRTSYTVIDSKTGKQVAFALHKEGLCKQLGLDTLEEVQGFLSDVKNEKNTLFQVKLNSVDIRDPFAPDASGVSEDDRRLSKQEWFDILVRQDIDTAVREELKVLQSYLVLPKEKRVVPNGFATWDDFKAYYKKLDRWFSFKCAGYTKKPVPLREGEKIEHSGATQPYEDSTQKAAQIGCGIVGMGWFAFLGFSLLMCLLMKANGCISGCSHHVPSEYDEWKSENPPW